VVSRSVLIAVALGAVACSPPLPDPDSPGAQVLQTRCGGCHRLSAPSTMTFEMWKVQVERMRDRMAQAGRSRLTPDEERVLLEYLRQHAGQG